MKFSSITYLLALAISASAVTTKVFDFNVSWVNANPDGLKERQVIGINGQWPLPVIEVDKGDRVIVNLHNGLPDRNTSIHFHGMFQNGTNHMDGPVMVTQCPVSPGGDITYNFTVDQNGTYWYHAHVEGQYPDGYRQALIVHDINFPYDYDEDIFVTLSDWYHDTINNIDPLFMNLYNPSGAEPIPNNFLFNETQNLKIPVKPNTTYMLRILNIGAFVGQYFYIEGHDMTIVEVDGVYTEPTPADILYIAVAQRYTILFTTKDTTDKNFPIVTIVDQSLLDIIPSDLKLNFTNWLEYDNSLAFEQADMTVGSSDDLVAFDDTTLIPYDHEELLPDPDYEIELTVEMNNLLNGVNYAFFNNITYTAPKVPSLYTVLSANETDVENPAIYGEFTHSWVLKHNEVVQIVVNSNDTGSHPFHLHGHTFQVVHRSPPYDDPTPFDPNNHTAFNDPPIRRDTVVVHPNGNFVIRFVADNPGVWMFHCHIEWHLTQGLAIILVEAPIQLQQTLSIPEQHYDVCRANKVPYKGNAAANSEDFLDLSGQNTQQPFLPDGFTARGIIALVFSVFSAFAGMAAISWYGLSDLSLSEVKMIQSYERDAGLEPDDIDPEDISNHGHDDE